MGQRKKEYMRKNNEEVPEYKNNKKKKKSYVWKQNYKGQQYKHKLEQRTIWHSKWIAAIYNRIRDASKMVKKTLNDKTNLDVSYEQYRRLTKYGQISHNVSFSHHY